MSKAYTNYIVEHCDYVARVYYFLVEHKIIKDEFIHRIKNHDLSKWSDEEYKAYDKYFYGKNPDEVKEQFNNAWLHHIHHNPHHWQYWVLINDDDGTQALEMPEEYVIEMFCDHAAFSFKSGNLTEVEDWYKAHKTTMMLHENTKIFYEDLLKKYLAAVKEDNNGKA